MTPLTRKLDKAPCPRLFILIAVSIGIHRAPNKARILFMIVAKIFAREEPTAERTIRKDSETLGRGHRQELHLGGAFYEVIHRLDGDGFREAAKLGEDRKSVV